MNIFKQCTNFNSNICVCLIVGTLLLISIIPFSYAEKTYNVYVEPLPEFGNFAQNSVPDALYWWEQKRSDIKFKIVSNPESADFTIQWVKDFGTEVIGYAFDDLFIEVGLGDSNVDGNWYPYSANYVTDIMKHEIGHILGYDHVNNPQDIMYPVSANIEYGLIELQLDLLSNEAYFMPVLSTKDITTINYQINSQNAEYGFDVYFVPSEADLDKWASDAPFNFYQDENCYAENIFHTSGICNVEYGSGLLIISNEIESNKRTYFDLKMTEQSIKNNNILSSAPSSSTLFDPSNKIPATSSSYDLYVDENSRFSIEYPANWYIYYDAEYDMTQFVDDEYHWTSLFTVEGFELNNDVAPLYESTTDAGILEELKEMEKTWCNTQTYSEQGQICYNFEIINSDIKTLDSGHKMFVLSERYTLQYGPDFPGEFPITAIVTEVHNGNDGWIIYTESDDVSYPIHKEKIMNFIQSFSLSDEINPVQILSASPTPPTQIPAIPVPSPQVPTLIPTQSEIIEGAFLKIDDPVISLSYDDQLAKIYGNIGREPNKGERVIVNFNHPDNTVHGEKLQITKDGNFETFYRVDMNSVTGNYLIDVMLRETLIGKVTLTLNKYSSQSSTTTPSIPTNQQNPVIVNNLERIDVESNEFQQEKSFEIGIKNESFEIETDDEQFKTGIEDEQFESEISDNGGGCLIATATYGSELAPQVQQLRELRDNQLLNTEYGTTFMGTFNDIYYSFSPTIADMQREHPLFKETVKLAITPMISTLSLMENAESESEVLSMGISVIMLNIGMYFAVPAIVIVRIRKRF